jgi:DNA-binding MarR family transcriptional regulator
MANKKSEQSAREELATKAWLGVVHAYNLCDTVLATRLAALGLRVGEHEMLANLYLSPGITQQELATRCFVAKSGISMLLTRMEGQALIRREPDGKDGRIKRLSLTEAGAQLAKQTMAIQREIIGVMTGSLSEQELGWLGDMSRQVVQQLQALADA